MGSQYHLLNVFVAITILLISFFVPHVLLSAYLESTEKKSGIGKSIIGISVVDEHLKQLTFSKSLTRSLSKFLSLSVFGLGFFLYFFNKKNQALHDILAKSVVVTNDDIDVNKNEFVFNYSF